MLMEPLKLSDLNTVALCPFLREALVAYFKLW